MTKRESLPTPVMATSDNPSVARLKVDVAQTGFFDGREFRLVRKITSPIIYKFVAPVEFILSFQAFSITTGEFEFYAWRGDNATELTTFPTEVPIFAKNTSNTRTLYDGAPYVRQIQVFEGGTIDVIDPNIYADFEWLKTSNATGQRTSLEGSGIEERYLAAGTYYLQFIGNATGSFRLTFEERP